MSTRKKAPVQPPAKSGSTAPATPQSAAERRLAETQVRALITKFTPTKKRLIAAVRRSLRKQLPTSHEVVYEYRDCFVISYSPSERGYEGVLAIRGSADGIKFYFNRGKDLPDPTDLLQGSGGQARWIQLEGAATLSRPDVTALINAAIARTQTPFAQSGNGSVVIRTTAAKPPRRTRRRA